MKQRRIQGYLHSVNIKIVLILDHGKHLFIYSTFSLSFGPFVLPVSLPLHCCPLLPLSVDSWLRKPSAGAGRQRRSQRSPCRGRHSGQVGFCWQMILEFATHLLGLFLAPTGQLGGLILASQFKQPFQLSSFHSWLPFYCSFGMFWFFIPFTGKKLDKVGPVDNRPSTN